MYDSLFGLFSDDEEKRKYITFYNRNYQEKENYSIKLYDKALYTLTKISILDKMILYEVYESQTTVGRLFWIAMI